MEGNVKDRQFLPLEQHPTTAEQLIALPSTPKYRDGLEADWGQSWICYRGAIYKGSPDQQYREGERSFTREQCVQP